MFTHILWWHFSNLENASQTSEVCRIEKATPFFLPVPSIETDHKFFDSALFFCVSIWHPGRSRLPLTRSPADYDSLFTVGAPPVAPPTALQTARWIIAEENAKLMGCPKVSAGYYLCAWSPSAPPNKQRNKYAIYDASQMTLDVSSSRGGSDRRRFSVVSPVLALASRQLAANSRTRKYSKVWLHLNQ